MSKYIEFIPSDTLFFRGSTPMEAGMMNTVSLFPPPVSVIKGALWTESCQQNNKAFGEKIPFEVTAIFIKKYDKYYVPAPATWYYDAKDKITSGEKFKGTTIIESKNIKSEMGDLGMQTSARDVEFVVPSIDAKSLSGAWIDVAFITEPKSKISGKDTVLTSSDVYSLEPRTGVALDINRKAKEGQLYSSTHIRLNEGISIVVKVSDCSELILKEKESGCLHLGGEQRICWYEVWADNKISDDENEIGKEGRFLSLVPIEATEDNLKSLVASQKLVVTSGWNMKTQFHKPSVSWIPAGAVFNKKINESCISLKEINNK